MASQEDKTLQPTAKRIRDAREKGQIATSRDLSMAMGSLAATGVLVAGGSMLLHRLNQTIADTLGHLGDTARGELTIESVMPLILSGGALIGITVGPIACAAAGAGLLVGGAQTRFNFAPKALKINWAALNPANGFKKLAPSKSGIATLKAILTATVIAVIAWQVTKALTDDAARLTWTTPLASAARGWDESVRLLWRASFALLAIGAADFGVQKWQVNKQLKMSHQEFRDEQKMMETNPETRARVRRIQRDMMRRRMLQSIQSATVVVTNPTHFAVALSYQREKNVAPVVVAKGQELMAAKIREIARHHSVPIIENPPLARALFKECEIGDVIPGPLFGAVAEILAYLIRIKQLVL